MTDIPVAALPEPGHIRTDALFAASETLQRVSVDQSTEQGRVATAAWWLKYLDAAGFVLVPDPRKVDVTPAPPPTASA